MWKPWENEGAGCCNSPKEDWDIWAGSTYRGRLDPPRSQLSLLSPLQVLASPVLWNSCLFSVSLFWSCSLFLPGAIQCWADPRTHLWASDIRFMSAAEELRAHAVPLWVNLRSIWLTTWTLCFCSGDCDPFFATFSTRCLDNQRLCLLSFNPIYSLYVSKNPLLHTDQMYLHAVPS